MPQQLCSVSPQLSRKVITVELRAMKPIDVTKSFEVLPSTPPFLHVSVPVASVPAEEEAQWPAPWILEGVFF